MDGGRYVEENRKKESRDGEQRIDAFHYIMQKGQGNEQVCIA